MTYSNRLPNITVRASSQAELVGHHRRTAVLECNHGYLLLAFARVAQAESYLKRARTLFNHFSDRCPQLDETIARLYVEMGRFDLAEQAILRSVKDLELGCDEPAILAESLRTHGLVLTKLGHGRKARGVLDRAYQIAERCATLRAQA